MIMQPSFAKASEGILVRGLAGRSPAKRQRRIVGRSTGKVIIQRRGMTLEVLSQSISGESCSMRDGNAFAM